MAKNEKVGTAGNAKAAAPEMSEETGLNETGRVQRPSPELQKLIDNPNLNQAGNDRGSHDEPETGSQTGADID